MEISAQRLYLIDSECIMKNLRTSRKAEVQATRQEVEFGEGQNLPALLEEAATVTAAATLPLTDPATHRTTDAAPATAIEAVSALPADEALNTDFWNFGKLWLAVSKAFGTIDTLYEVIRARQSQIKNQVETYRPVIGSEKKNPLHIHFASVTEGTKENGTYKIASDRLESIEDGISGSYFLLDEEGKKKYVIKPVDEEFGCLNHPKGWASPMEKGLVRSHIAPYTSALREAAAYEIGKMIGVANVMPSTALAICESDKFALRADGVSPTEISRYLEKTELQSREKLCSVQEFISEAKPLAETLQQLIAAGLTDKEIEDRFDPVDIENANILIWTTHDTDAHSGNMLVYVKGVDSIGNEIFGLKKIDNGLCFPSKNRQLNNAIGVSSRPLSDAGKAKIDAIDVEKVAEQLKKYGLESAIPAMITRIKLLKQLAQTPDITIREINRTIADKGRREEKMQEKEKFARIIANLILEGTMV